MKFLNKRIFGSSPCNNCLVNSMCHTDCVKLNIWIRRGIHLLRIYKYSIKWGSVLSYYLFIVYKTDLWFPFPFINPILTAIIITLIFMPFPFITWYILDVLSYYAGKNRLDIENIQKMRIYSNRGNVI